MATYAPGVLCRQMAALATDLRNLIGPVTAQVADAVTPDEWRAVRRVHFVGSGNSHHAGRAVLARHAWAVLPVHGTVSEEFSPLLYHAFAGHLSAALADVLGREPFQPARRPASTPTEESGHTGMSTAADTNNDITELVLDMALRLASPGTPRPPAGEEANLADLGLDSLTVVQLMVDVESEFGVRFPAAMIDAQTFRCARTIAEAVQALRAGSPGGRP